MRHNEIAIADAHQLFHLGRNQQDRCAGLGEFGNNGEHFVLRPDIEPPRWFVEKEKPRFSREPTAEHHFLLVTAAEGPNALQGPGNVDSKSAGQPLDAAGFFLPSDASTAST